MNDTDLTGFIAYPSSPKDIGESIRAACVEIKRQHASWKMQPWEANDIAGYCLIDPILEEIRATKVLIADVTQLNFNVSYEIGYAIGLRKRVFLIRNRSIATDQRLARDVGLFDTMGYEDYSNSTHLLQKIKSIASLAPMPLSDAPVNKNVPVYIVTPREKAETEIRIISRVKKTGGIFFRSFDPVENARLSVRAAIDNSHNCAATVRHASEICVGDSHRRRSSRGMS